MLKIRLIPILLLKDGLLVRSELFRIHQIIGNPINEIKRFNEWNVDEIIYLNISNKETYNLNREDHKIKGINNSIDILEEVSKTCFVPLTWGGNIKTIDEMKQCFNKGADKITLNSEAVRNPNLITKASKTFGSQAIVISIDILKNEVFIDGGKKATGLNPEEWAHQVEELGAGEILIQVIDRDGTGKGYDIDLIQKVTKTVSIPVIACSGIGRYDQYVDGIKAGASAVASANIWHFKELSDKNAKRTLLKNGIDIRI